MMAPSWAFGAWTGCPWIGQWGAGRGGGSVQCLPANSQTNDCSETGEAAFEFGLGETVDKAQLFFLLKVYRSVQGLAKDEK